MKNHNNGIHGNVVIPKDKFLISVIVPTYNRSQLLTYTLQSLIGQTMNKADFEVVIVDDGSTDDTFDMIKTYEGLLNFKYVYQIDKGYRPASARNLGIRVAEGGICMFIDSGIIVKSDCLKQHLRAHNQHGTDLALVGYTYGWGADETALTASINPHDADASIAKLVEMGNIWDIRENIYRKYQDKIHDLVVPWTLFYGGHFSTSTQALFEVGLFDENYDGNWGTEDQDLGYRLHLANKEIMLCRDAVVLHLPHESDSAAKEREGFANCQYFNHKFQTLETQLFLDCYAKDVAVQFTHSEVFDFHEHIINHQPLAKSQHSTHPELLASAND